MNTDPKPILIIPDVHLRLAEMKNVLQAWGERGEVFFLGDFFDDFGDTPEGNAEMARFLKNEILGKSGYKVLIGNHDLHYHPDCPRQLRCSGFSDEKKKAIGEILGREEFAAMEWAGVAGPYLLTHAGLHPRLIPALMPADPRELANWVNDTCWEAVRNKRDDEPLLRAGYIRYGTQPVGGVVWMDYREYEHIPEVRQIFGHTPLRSHSQCGPDNEPSYCLDTNLQCVGVVGADGELKVVPVREKIDFPEEVARSRAIESTKVSKVRSGKGRSK
jgi:hypothetical protein